MTRAWCWKDERAENGGGHREDKHLTIHPHLISQHKSKTKRRYAMFSVKKMMSTRLETLRKSAHRNLKLLIKRPEARAPQIWREEFISQWDPPRHPLKTAPPHPRLDFNKLSYLFFLIAGTSMIDWWLNDILMSSQSFSSNKLNGTYFLSHAETKRTLTLIALP